MSDIKKLQYEINRVQSVLNEANGALHEPVSFAREEYKAQLSQSRSFIGMKLSQSLSKGRPQEVLLMGGILGAMWCGAAAYDGIRNVAAQAKAKKQLLACYKELAAKQNLLIEEMIQINKALTEQVDDLEDKKEGLEARQKEIFSLLSRMREVEKMRTV